MESTIAEGTKKWKLRKAPKSHWNKIAQYDHTNFNLAPLIDGSTGRPKTGLTKEDERRLEKAIGLEEGELAPRSIFWRDFIIKLDDKIYNLDLDNPEDELAFLFMAAHKFVAFGHEGLKKKAKALYILYNDVDEAKTQVRKRNVKKEAYAKFNEMSTQEMIDVLMVLGERIVSTDPHIIEAMMGKVVETKGKEFLDVAGDNNFKMKLFVYKCLHYDILSKGAGKDIMKEVMISYKDEFIGEGIEGAVKQLGKQANQKIYLALQKRLETAQAAGTLAGAPLLTGYEVEEKVENAKKPRSVSNRKITSNAASNKMKAGAKGLADQSSVVNEIVGDGNDSGEYDGDGAGDIIDTTK